ncbi:hypothetical protein DL93DRAFT_2158440 [Clavulina sp. PMI_390]|nr:hypothetical protein DL93DRAFT_2158440 [Clavulina sp. PMI_390]
MPKIRTNRTKRPPEGYEDIEGILDDYAKKMRDAENESHEGKRKTESLWPIMRISHARSKYIYELYYSREAISKQLYDWLLKEGYADANLIAKWKKTGYEKLCCVRCIQTRDAEGAARTLRIGGHSCVCADHAVPVRNQAASVNWHPPWTDTSALLPDGLIPEPTLIRKLDDHSPLIFLPSRRSMTYCGVSLSGLPVALSGSNKKAARHRQGIVILDLMPTFQPQQSLIFPQERDKKFAIAEGIGSTLHETPIIRTPPIAFADASSLEKEMADRIWLKPGTGVASLSLPPCFWIDMDRVGQLAANAFDQLVKRKATDQGGVIDGINPVTFDSTDPIKLWIVQAGIILCLCQGLAMICARIRQPRVVAEVVSGIILGPSIMGHIPHFSARIFPTASLPYLNLTATIALVLFLFLMGLETDVSAMKRLLRRAGPISLAGMLLPFGLGAAVAVPIYNTFVDHSVVTFGHFLLFTSVALSITAFPVLCRILLETKLIETPVGIVVLAAGVGNDVVGWILLALTVALVNATQGVSAVYILLCGLGWTFFMLYPVRIGFRYIAHRTGNLDGRGPTPLMMMLTFLVVFTSAFFTDIIGIHPIFGGFLAGLAMPHDGGFAIGLVEKIEDIVTILLLPIYFVLSGLKTDLSTLNTGKAWGYTWLLIIVAFVGKFVGCFGAAKVVGFNYRESSAIGALMSCKGLVELIVLNVGLQAGILDTRLFSMFVFMAVILTLLTTPLTLLIYPDHLRKSDEKMIDIDGSSSGTNEKDGFDSPNPTITHPALPAEGAKSRFTVVLESMENIPAVMTIIQLLQLPASSSSSSRKIDGLRLVELSERTSAMMRGADNANAAAELLSRDALVKVVERFTRMNRLSIHSSLSVVSQDYYADSVVRHASRVGSDLIVVPWSAAAPATSRTAATPAETSYNPFAGMFGLALNAPAVASTMENSVVYSQFIRQVFAQASSTSSDVAVVVDRNASSAADGQHIFLPFFGGPDDRLALTLIAQLTSTPGSNVTATVVRLTKTEEELGRQETADTIDEAKALAQAQGFTVTSMQGAFPDTVYAHPTTETRMTSQTADHILWGRLSAAASPNLTFEDASSSRPLHTALERARSIASSSSSRTVVVAVGRARRLAVESHTAELRDIATESRAHSTGELRKTVGDVASAFVVAAPWPLVVLQASAGSGSVTLEP